jgi:hypothetical protein
VLIEAFDENFMNDIGAPNCPIHLLPMELDDQLHWACPESHALKALAPPSDYPIGGLGV